MAHRPVLNLMTVYEITTYCLSSAFTELDTLGYATANKPHADVLDVNQSPVNTIHILFHLLITLCFC
jgi:hypothetical protein